MENNHFVIKLFSQGNFKFAARGGPWIYDGNALLVAPFDGYARPYEPVLDSVPVWVRVFDIPWKRQTRAYGRAICVMLGEVLEVDAPKTGHTMNEFLRIRVKLPYNRRLQKEVILEYKAHGVGKQRKFQLKYERVPRFCFHCGFMGHDKLAYEKKLLGFPPKAYDSTLRCSPYKKIDHRTVYTPSLGRPKARRGMSFSLGSVGSATHKEHTRSSGSSRTNDGAEIPHRVDAHDNFEHVELPGSDVADQTLAKEVENMELRPKKEKPKCCKVQQMAAQFEAQAPATGNAGVSKPRKKKGGLPKKVLVGRRTGSLVIRDEPLESEEMIPAIRGLSSLGSFGSASTSMEYNGTVLGKRQVDGTYLWVHKKGKVDSQQVRVQQDSTEKVREEEKEGKTRAPSAAARTASPPLGPPRRLCTVSSSRRAASGAVSPQRRPPPCSAPLLCLARRLLEPRTSRSSPCPSSPERRSSRAGSASSLPRRLALQRRRHPRLGPSPSWPRRQRAAPRAALSCPPPGAPLHRAARRGRLLLLGPRSRAPCWSPPRPERAAAAVSCEDSSSLRPCFPRPEIIAPSASPPGRPRSLPGRRPVVLAGPSDPLSTLR
ncbi:hypothetical protein D1007_07549 [Hordeum vulgare]|nr:hypothetical protein D1007_07549 [Hordeum vulgare]